MSQRFLRGLVRASIVAIMVATIGVAVTWQHWWWLVTSARVTIDGKPTTSVTVYRGPDGRYLLYYRNRSKQWYMHEDIVPGYHARVDTTYACALGDRYGWPAEAYIFPFCAYGATVPLGSDPMTAHTDISLDPDIRYESHGFSFNNRLDDELGPNLGKAVRYRVTIK